MAQFHVVEQSHGRAALTLPFVCSYRHRVGVEIDWPMMVEDAQSREWTRTGKYGTDIATGMPSAEFCRGEQRKWLRSDGVLVAEVSDGTS